MGIFLSCDWGTSSFRLRAVSSETLQLLAEENSDNGTATTYGRWCETGKTNNREARLLFYLAVIQEHIEKIERSQNLSLTGVPLIISGMASSSIGMLNLPYQDLPYSVDGSDTIAEYITELTDFNHPVLLISGVKSENDVMRGEETQLIGSAPEAEGSKDETIYIFPGTHSKHIQVRNKQVIDFKTYMTGEFFELLSMKSILKTSVENYQNLESSNGLKYFQKGVQDSIRENLLHSSFLVRTNELFGKLNRKENYNYLSGLLIGTELKELVSLTSTQICLCGSFHLKNRYDEAFQVLGLQDKIQILSAKQADEAVVRGQLLIYNHYKNKE